MELEELDTITRKKLLNELIRYGDTPQIQFDYGISVPPALYITYRCGSCKNLFEMKILRPDLKGLNDFITCSSCNSTAYPSNISVKQARKRKSWEDIWQ